MVQVARAILCRQLVVSHAVAAVDKAVELAGGRAYFRKSPLERLARDVRAARFHPPCRARVVPDGWRKDPRECYIVAPCRCIWTSIPFARI